MHRYNEMDESVVSETSDSGPGHQPLMGPPKK